jgi:hypothetical protein
MIKVYIALALILASASTGWKTRGWYEDSQEKKVIIDKVEKRNEVIAEVDKTVEVVTKIVYRDREKIIQLPPIDTSIECPIVELTELRNQANGSLDTLLFQSKDEVPSTTN